MIHTPEAALGGQHKIRADHLERLAYVYIRQSSLKQVAHNRESQLNQYRLVERAQTLGWAKERIRVIDTDQGLSGQGSAYRQGFQELVAELSLGHVGIVFGYEVSRLARNNSDWYHLLDLAAVFGSLIADIDGIYDPRRYNDRLLLGLKGTMSEAELHLLRQRLEAGRLSQVYRGVYRQRLPTGLVRLPDGTVVKDPDDQVRHCIELVLAKFEELGSCPKVLRYLRDAHILLPRRQRGGLLHGDLVWKQPSDAAVYETITNPAYAGAFAYGRKQTDPARRKPGRRATGLVRQPMEAWLHLQQGVYPAYISWEQYLANQQRLQQNAMHFTEQVRGAQGAARRGAALLQGLATCGCCGATMNVAYKQVPRYTCQALVKRYGGATCMSVSAPSVDAVVVAAFFEALRPAELDALEAILAGVETERQRLRQHWEERLKRARYEAHLAQRQYDAVDPENRLVAAELERRWEDRLQQLRDVEEAYARFQSSEAPSRLPPELRAQLEHVCESLPALWPELANIQRKELLRSLIGRVILYREAPDRTAIKIVWISGHYSELYAQTPTICQRDVSRYEEMVERIGTLWQQGLSDTEIAARLTEEGFHTARAAWVPPTSVQKIRKAHQWRGRRLHPNTDMIDGRLTVGGLARRLKVSPNWVYRRLYNGTIDPAYVERAARSQRYLIEDHPELMARLQRQAPKTDPT